MINSKGCILITPRSLTAGGLDSVAELEPLLRQGFEMVPASAGRVPDVAELESLLESHDVVGWLAGVEHISASLLESANALRVIARNGVGAENIDISAANRQGVEVRTTPGANAQSVAELAVAHGLSLLRGIPQSNAALHDGRWERTKGRELSDIRVGIVGYGAIGRRVAELFTSLGAAVAVHDPFVPEGRDHTFVDNLDTLLSQTDLLSLHVPAPSDGPLLNSTRLERMPTGSIVVNTARAALIDSSAMYHALESGAVRGYAVDAFDKEPPDLDDVLSHPHTVTTPHVGGYTNASVRRATEAAVVQLLEVLE